jgi:hypothetical protein
MNVDEKIGVHPSGALFFLEDNILGIDFCKIARIGGKD